MSDRCEPPEELRGVDGWHWVQEPVNTLVLARWHRAESPGVEPLWTSTHHVYSGTPRYAAREWNWRYVAPVMQPDEADVLRGEANEWCQKVQLFEDRIHKLRAELAAARNEIARLATQAAAMRDALLATGRTYSGVIPPLPPMPTGDTP